jgi:hypothetical protein
MVLGIYWWYQKASFVGNKLDKWRNKPGDRWYSPTLTFLKNPHGSTTKASFTSDQERDLWDLLTWWALDFAIEGPKTAFTLLFGSSPTVLEEWFCENYGRSFGVWMLTYTAQQLE